MKRCDECNLTIIPDEVFAIWKEKFGADEKPHHTAICKICGKDAGEHFGTDCPKIECTGCKKGLEFVAKVIMSNREAELKRLGLCPFCRQTLIQSIKDLG